MQNKKIDQKATMNHTEVRLAINYKSFLRHHLDSADFIYNQSFRTLSKISYSLFNIMLL